jgi:DNA repair protein SbcC/Rad50
MVELSRRGAADAATAAATHSGEARQFAATMPSVSDCEEALLVATTKLERVTELEAVLEKAESLLSSAEQAVQRNIAPVISAFVGPRLEKVTRGRYSEVTVNPADLAVGVVDASHTPRRATSLSHGTAEQVYFLLRAALASVLCNSDEPAPLLLDDVTVQSDRERTRGILEVLHDLSATHQIVLFTQEDDVLQWAEQNLKEPVDLLHRIPPAHL